MLLVSAKPQINTKAFQSVLATAIRSGKSLFVQLNAEEKGVHQYQRRSIYSTAMRQVFGLSHS